MIHNINCDIGVVIIGRNEGDRLLRCIQTLRESDYFTVYVDSGSVDKSVEIAKELGVEVVRLDPNHPFSAARARNEGFEQLIKFCPKTRFVQFVDGDCVLIPGWLENARNALDENLKRAAVIGHLLECNADSTIYNRLCALEWKSTPGDISNFGNIGGLLMIRADVFRSIGGFNPSIIAGEDSELAVRMNLAGYLITKIDEPMAIHESSITSFRQWWRRAVRAGHAIGQRAFINGRSVTKDCIRERRSTWVWGVGIPLVIFTMLIPTRGLSLVLMGGYVMLGFRVFMYRRKQGDNIWDALLYSRFLILAKFANGVGLVRFYHNNIRKKFEIIEYK